MREEVGVPAEELGGASAVAVRHALVDERQVSPGQRLVKELRPALRRRVPPQRAAEVERRFREVGVAREIDEGGPDVLAVAVLLVGDEGGLEAREKLVVGEQIADLVCPHGTMVTWYHYRVQGFYAEDSREAHGGAARACFIVGEDTQADPASDDYVYQLSILTTTFTYNSPEPTPPTS